MQLRHLQEFERDSFRFCVEFLWGSMSIDAPHADYGLGGGSWEVACSKFARKNQFGAIY
jgi:hypothetical protein